MPGSVSDLLTTMQQGTTAINSLSQIISNATATDAAGTTGLRVSGVRARLTGNLTLFVRPDGSDSNPGTSNTAAGAFLTIQKAANTVAMLDISIFNVTIQVGAGTYTSGVTFNGPWLGSGIVSLLGDVTTPTNVVISTTGANAITVTGGCFLTIGGFRLTVAASGFLLSVGADSNVTLTGKMDWGPFAFGGINVAGVINHNMTSATISGGGTGAFIAASGAGTFLNNVVAAWTSTANYAVNQFAIAQSFGSLQCGGMTFPVGGSSVTGTRFIVQNGGFINTNGGGANFFPGSVAGSGTNFSVSPWGLYI